MTGVTDYTEVREFFVRFAATAVKRRAKLARTAAPLEAIQDAALTHPDPFMRRICVGFLDHYANEASTQIFAQALGDPTELVRHTALHSIACETCRSEELCVTDVVPHLVSMLETDASPEVRHKTIPVLLRLAERDQRARQAVERAAQNDDDDLVREVAARALAGEHVRARKMYERHARARRD